MSAVIASEAYSNITNAPHEYLTLRGSNFRGAHSFEASALSDMLASYIQREPACDASTVKAFSANQLLDVRLVLCVAEIRRVSEDIAILERTTERRGPFHPVRRIGPQHFAVAHGLPQIV